MPGTSAWAAAALADEVHRGATAAEGQCNHTLNRAAFVLDQIIGGGHLDAAEVADLLERRRGRRARCPGGGRHRGERPGRRQALAGAERLAWS